MTVARLHSTTRRCLQRALDAFRLRRPVSGGTSVKQFLQARVAQEFIEHPEYLGKDFDEVRPKIFTESELDWLHKQTMLIGCLMLPATEWRPHIELTDHQMVFVDYHMGGPSVSGRFDCPKDAWDRLHDGWRGNTA